MSKMCEIRLTIYGHDKTKVADIKAAVRQLWPFERFEPGADNRGNRTAICSRGEDSLSASTSEQDLVADMVASIKKANEANCDVLIEVVHLNK